MEGGSVSYWKIKVPFDTRYTQRKKNCVAVKNRKRATGKLKHLIIRREILDFNLIFHEMYRA